MAVIEVNKYPVEAVSKCHTDVLDYDVGKNAQGTAN